MNFDMFKDEDNSASP
jgi:hypothetical protein